MGLIGLDREMVDMVIWIHRITNRDIRGMVLTATS